MNNKKEEFRFQSSVLVGTTGDLGLVKISVFLIPLGVLHLLLNGVSLIPF